eukprot:352291-Chlamydomonas_euryale.AAC.3
MEIQLLSKGYGGHICANVAGSHSQTDVTHPDAAATNESGRVHARRWHNLAEVLLRREDLCGCNTSHECLALAQRTCVHVSQLVCMDQQHSASSAQARSCSPLKAEKPPCKSSTWWRDNRMRSQLQLQQHPCTRTNDVCIYAQVTTKSRHTCNIARAGVASSRPV